MPVRAFVGFVIAVAMHMKNGWWLDGGDRVREMLIVLVVAAVTVTLWKAPEPAYKRALALWGGFMVGVTITLFAGGGGTIFPIVLAVAAGLSAAAVLAGGLVGVVRERLSH